jgi:hypothetical protein
VGGSRDESGARENVRQASSGRPYPMMIQLPASNYPETRMLRSRLRVMSDVAVARSPCRLPIRRAQCPLLAHVSGSHFKKERSIPFNVENVNDVVSLTGVASLGG